MSALHIPCKRVPLTHAICRLILVDSTRSGKRMPDALSKTVPIWCTVVNRAVKRMFSKGAEWDGGLYTPPGVVSPQEHTHIERRIDEWADLLVVSLPLSCLPFNALNCLHAELVVHYPRSSVPAPTNVGHTSNLGVPSSTASGRAWILRGGVRVGVEASRGRRGATLRGIRLCPGIWG